MVKPQKPVDNNSGWISACPIANGQRRIIMRSRVRADQHSIFLAPPAMNQLSGKLITDPFGFKILLRNKSISRLGPF